MERPQSIPTDLWDQIPLDLRPAIAAVVVGLEHRIVQLETRVAELESRLNQNSTNSSRPPSSDGPQVKPAPPRPPSRKKRGGQPGHAKRERTLLPPDQIIPLKPSRCRRCCHALDGDDPHPLVHQVHEVPPVQPHVVEYRCHQLACPRCQAWTRAQLPTHVQGGYGPNVQAITALLAGGHRLGKRAISQVMGDLFGLPISPAAVCDLQKKTAAALESIHVEARDYTRKHPANVDETGWKQGKARAWLWVAVTTLVTAFVIRPKRDRQAFLDLMGRTPPVLTTDRYSVYCHLDLDLDWTWTST